MRSYIVADGMGECKLLRAEVSQACSPRIVRHASSKLHRVFTNLGRNFILDLRDSRETCLSRCNVSLQQLDAVTCYEGTTRY
jgi:hypothetical protein